MFEVHCALPCLSIFIREIANKCKSQTTIPDVPIVNGFVYEQKCVNAIRAEVKIIVRRPGVITAYDVVELDGNLEELLVGVVYHLRFTYPVIDYVGYLQRQDISSPHLTLVFIQI